LKRSNRLVLLIGVFLAIIAFIAILVLFSNPSTPPDGTQGVPTELPTVIATADIPLGTTIQAEQVTTQVLPVDARAADSFQDVSLVIGKVARQPVTTGQQVTNSVLTGGDPGTLTDIKCPPTLRCMAVEVDQVTGVGTVIKTGDYVDMVVGFTGDKFPVISLNADDSFTVVSGINSTSVKLLLQGMQVLGTLLPPPPAETGTEEDTTQEPGTALNDQREIVILAVDAQQSEVIKFAQLDGSISLILRAPDDFVDPLTNQPLPPIPDETSGVILKTLVDTYGVLPPELVETILPVQANP
jgi:Flp pilus assembly protein CpaB